MISLLVCMFTGGTCWVNRNLQVTVWKCTLQHVSLQHKWNSLPPPLTICRQTQPNLIHSFLTEDKKENQGAAGQKQESQMSTHLFIYFMFHHLLHWNQCLIEKWVLDTHKKISPDCSDKCPAHAWVLVCMWVCHSWEAAFLGSAAGNGHTINHQQRRLSWIWLKAAELENWHSKGVSW